MSAIPTNSVPGQFESTPNENEQHKLETGNGRSERMRGRFAAVSELAELAISIVHQRELLQIVRTYTYITSVFCVRL